MTKQVTSVGRNELGKLLIDKDLRNTILVDTYNGAPLNMEIFRPMNPFYVWNTPCLPVPGHPGCNARSVESIWQGTKLINNTIDEKQFLSSPYKRPSEDERKINREFSYQDTVFIFNNAPITHIEARFLIYLTSYLFLLNDLLLDGLIFHLIDAVRNNKNIIFYDWDSNQDIVNVKESFSHSAILASWFGGTLYDDFLPKANNFLSKETNSIFLEYFYNLTTRYKFIHGKE